MAAAINIQLLTADEAQSVATFRGLPPDRRKGDLCTAELRVIRRRIESAVFALVTCVTCRPRMARAWNRTATLKPA